MNRHSVAATAIMAGAVIGGGIFALPAAFASVGFAAGLVLLAVFSSACAALHLMYARLLGGDHGHQFAHLAERHFGGIAGRAVAWMMLAELVLTLTAYLSLAPSFFRVSFGFGGHTAMFVFWAASSVLMFAPLGKIGIASEIRTAIIVATVFAVFAAGAARGTSVPAFSFSEWGDLLLPFGTLLFVSYGRSGVGRAIETWKRARAEGRGFSLRSTIVAGTLLPAGAYALFAFGALKLSAIPSADAISGIAASSSVWLVAALGVCGMLAIWTSYALVGGEIFSTLRRDFAAPRGIAAAAALAVPPAAYFALGGDFPAIVGFIGGAFLALESACIALMWRKAFPHARFRAAALALAAVFASGAVYEIVKFFSA